MLVINLPFKALMFLTLMRPYLVLFLVLWLKLVKDFLKVRCRLALLPFLISCLIWLDLVASLPLIKERILVIILLLDRKSGSAGMPRPSSYAVFCLKKKSTCTITRSKGLTNGRGLAHALGDRTACHGSHSQAGD